MSHLLAILWGFVLFLNCGFGQGDKFGITCIYMCADDGCSDATLVDIFSQTTLIFILVFIHNQLTPDLEWKCIVNVFINGTDYVPGILQQSSFFSWLKCVQIETEVVYWC